MRRLMGTGLAVALIAGGAALPAFAASTSNTVTETYAPTWVLACKGKTLSYSSGSVLSKTTTTDDGMGTVTISASVTPSSLFFADSAGIRYEVTNGTSGETTNITISDGIVTGTHVSKWTLKGLGTEQTSLNYGTGAYWIGGSCA